MYVLNPSQYFYQYFTVGDNSIYLGADRTMSYVLLLILGMGGANALKSVVRLRQASSWFMLVIEFMTL